MNAHIFHISHYDLAFLGTIFIGLTFAVLLWLTDRLNRSANRFLSLALFNIVFQMIWILGIDVRLGTYIPHWSWLPLQFSLTLSPLIYFYVLKITRPGYKFGSKDLLHFSPLLLQQGVLILEIKESIRTGVGTYDTLIFQQLSPVLQLLAFVSVIIYLNLSYRLIGRFYRRLKFNGGDRYRYELRWQHNLLMGFGLLWILWIPFIAADYFYYHHQISIYFYYPLYLLLAATAIWMGAVAFLRPEASSLVEAHPFLKPPLPEEMKQKGIWLKKAVQANLYYQDPELSLTALAEKLGLTTHELSRIINTALKKSFNDFINEYRVAEVIKRMQDPAYDSITLLGIAYDSGFNSKSTFNLIFKKITGKTPAEYKAALKKEFLSYNLGRHEQFAAVISNQETTHRWSSEKLSRNYMFRNYLKIAWRNITRNKAFSFINISGLGLGIACSLLIFLWVHDELSVDAFHANSARLYNVYEREFSDGKVEAGRTTPGLLATELKRNIPEIKYASGYWEDEIETLFSVGEKKFSNIGTYADTDFFKMFSYPLLKGTASSALAAPEDIAISRRMADAVFGSPRAAIGQAIQFNNAHFFTVSAVFENLPVNTSQHFDFVINWQYLTKAVDWLQNWGDRGPQTFIQLQPGADATKVEAKIKNFVTAYLSTGYKTGFRVELGLQPLNEVYLKSVFKQGKPDGGRIEYVRLFTIVAIFILIIACFYMHFPYPEGLASGFKVFKQELLTMPGIKAVDYSAQPPSHTDYYTYNFNWPGKNPNTKVFANANGIGYDYFKLMGIQFVEGRAFSSDFSADTTGIIINETALKMIGRKNPLGRQVTLDGRQRTILGVVKDFHFKSLHEPIEPLIMLLNPKPDWGYVLVKTEAGKNREGLASMESVFTQMERKFAFRYLFADEEYQKLYNDEITVGKLSDSFSFLAIFISCLGLLGLTMFTAEQRRKEIGVRKIIGASEIDIVAMLSKDIVRLVILSAIIATPIAWVAMSSWLQNFAYRINMTGWMFLAAGLIAIFIALATVSYQAIRAALANPVNSLRTE